MDHPLMQLLFAALAVAAMVAAFFVATGLLLRGWRALRSRGYFPPAAALVLLGCMALATLLAALAFEGLGESWAGVAGSVLAFLFTTPLALLAAARLLPQRETRPAGARRVRLPVTSLLALGGVLTLLFGAALVWVALDPAAGISGTELLRVLVPLAALALGLFVAARRTRAQQRSAQPVDARLASDPRPPVLFLREFAREREPFVIGRAAELRPQLKAAQRWIPAWLRPDLGVQASATAEEYLADAVSISIGPLVALGAPGDYLQPLGAARDYAPDADWQQRFRTLAARAKAVLLMPGDSQALAWELAALRADGHAAKLLVPVGSAAFQQRSSLWIVGRIYGWRFVPWPVFRERLRSAGFTVPEAAPPPRSLLAFDAHGKGRWFAWGDAMTPQGFVGAMADALAGREPRAAPASPVPAPDWRDELRLVGLVLAGVLALFVAVQALR